MQTDQFLKHLQSTVNSLDKSLNSHIADFQSKQMPDSPELTNIKKLQEDFPWLKDQMLKSENPIEFMTNYLKANNVT